MFGILISVCLSVIVGFSGYIAGYNFLQWTIITLVSQFVLFFLINTISKIIVQMRLNKLEIDRLNAIDENRVRIACAVCDDPNDIVIKVGDVNEFRCSKCKSLNTVNVKISNYQKTEIFPDGVITEAFIEKMKDKNNGV